MAMKKWSRAPKKNKLKKTSKIMSTSTRRRSKAKRKTHRANSQRKKSNRTNLITVWNNLSTKKIKLTILMET